MKTALSAALLFAVSTIWCADEPKEHKPFELTTLLGETYHHCRIIKATPEFITITHDSGVSKISFELLGDEWREIYHYDPEKARAFAKKEESQRKLAEEKRRAAQAEYEKATTTQMAELAIIESKQARAKQTASPATNQSQPGALMPLPGDTTITSTTDVVVPPTSTITQIYTPGLNNGQRFIINQGTVFTPGDGTLYYVNPNYTPGFNTPPVIVCPPTTVKPTPKPPIIIQKK